MEQAKASTAKGQGRAPPYVAFRTFLTFLADMKEHGIPARIDPSVMQRVSGTVRNQLMTALRFLNLVDGNDAPTDHIRGLVQAHQTDTWPTALAGVLREAYPPIFALGLDTVSPAQLSEAFKPMAASDDVRRKCLVFFVQAAQSAAIPISSRIVAGMKRGSGGGPVRRRSGGARHKANGNGGSEKDGSTPPSPPPPPPPIPPGTGAHLPSMVLLMNLDIKEMTDEQQEAVWTLIRYFKGKGL